MVIFYVAFIRFSVWLEKRKTSSLRIFLNLFPQRTEKKEIWLSNIVHFNFRIEWKISEILEPILPSIQN